MEDLKLECMTTGFDEEDEVKVNLVTNSIEIKFDFWSPNGSSSEELIVLIKRNGKVLLKESECPRGRKKEPINIKTSTCFIDDIKNIERFTNKIIKILIDKETYVDTMYFDVYAEVTSLDTNLFTIKKVGMQMYSKKYGSIWAAYNKLAKHFVDKNGNSLSKSDKYKSFIF